MALWLEPRLPLDPKRQAFFERALEVDETIGRLLAEQFKTVAEIARASPDAVAAVMVGDQETGEEVRARARECMLQYRAWARSLAGSGEYLGS
jgi:hypothetical protein